MRRAFASLTRYICTARVAKHRLFVWTEKATLPDSQVVVFARNTTISSGSFTHDHTNYGHLGWAPRLKTALVTHQVVHLRPSRCPGLQERNQREIPAWKR